MSTGDASRRGEGAPPQAEDVHPRTFRLRHGAHDLVLSRGEMLIGRTSECQLALADPLVSRRHARLVIAVDRVVIEDLGSSNGVHVNGLRVHGSQKLESGDRILIGNEELVIFSASESAPFLRAQSTGRELIQTMAPPPSGVRSLGPGAPPAPAAAVVEDEPTRSGDAGKILCAMGDKALALGRADEAERLLGPQIGRCVADAHRTGEAPADVVEAMSRRAILLAAATVKASFVDRVVELHLALGRLMPASIVDDLYIVVRKVPTIDLTQLRDYIDALQARSDRFGPNDWFLLGRIQGLERLVSLL